MADPDRFAEMAKQIPLRGCRCSESEPDTCYEHKLVAAAIRAAAASAPAEPLRELLEECRDELEKDAACWRNEAFPGTGGRAERFEKWAAECEAIVARINAALAAPAVIHYAPYGPNAIGEFECGAKAVGAGYTERPGNVTCGECKKQSPGLWPQLAAPAVSAWRPISEAPNDRHTRLVCRETVLFIAWRVGDKWYHDDGNAEGKPVRCYPTHYMPLPAPPEPK